MIKHNKNAPNTKTNPLNNKDVLGIELSINRPIPFL